MAYYIMAERKKGIYEPLDISKSIYFQKKSKYTKPYAYSLEEIDLFTTNFQNELELRNYLTTNDILPYELTLKKLSIRIKNKAEYQKVRHDFLYQNSKKYIENHQELIKLIHDRYLQKDYAFLEKFAINFQDFYDCKSIASEIRNYASRKLNYEYCKNHLEERDKNGDDAVTRMIKLLIYRYIEYPDGKTFYLPSIKYNNIHKILAFTNNYDLKMQELDRRLNINNLEEYENPKIKIRKNDQSQIEGQYSLFEDKN